MKTYNLCCVGMYGELGHGLIRLLDAKNATNWLPSTMGDSIVGVVPSIICFPNRLQPEERLSLRWLAEQDRLDSIAIPYFRRAEAVLFFTGNGHAAPWNSDEDLRLWRKWARRCDENPTITPIILSYYDEDTAGTVCEVFRKEYRIEYCIYGAKNLSRNELLSRVLEILNTAAETLPARKEVIANLELKRAKEKLQAEEGLRRAAEKAKAEEDAKYTQELARAEIEAQRVQEKIKAQEDAYRMREQAKMQGAALLAQERAKMTEEVRHQRDDTKSAPAILPKTLAQLEEFSFEERKLYADITRELKDGKIADFIKYAPNFSHEMVFKFAAQEKDSEIYRAFCCPELEEYWQTQTKRFNDTAANVVGMQRIRRSNFDIFLSYYILSEYYHYSKRYGENHPESLRLLIRTCSYQCFHALQKRMEFIVQALERSIHSPTEEVFNEKLALWGQSVMQEIADLWAPGLLEASRLALALGIYYLKYKPKERETYMWHYRQALFYIFLAQKLEDHPVSQQAKTVLYQSQDRPLLAVYNITTWEQMLSWLLCHHPVNGKDLIRARTLACSEHKRMEEKARKMQLEREEQARQKAVEQEERLRILERKLQDKTTMLEIKDQELASSLTAITTTIAALEKRSAALFATLAPKQPPSAELQCTYEQIHICRQQAYITTKPALRIYYCACQRYLEGLYASAQTIAEFVDFKGAEDDFAMSIANKIIQHIPIIGEWVALDVSAATEAARVRRLLKAKYFAKITDPQLEAAARILTLAQENQLATISGVSFKSKIMSLFFKPHKTPKNYCQDVKNKAKEDALKIMEKFITASEAKKEITHLAELLLTAEKVKEIADQDYVLPQKLNKTAEPEAKEALCIN